MCLTLYQQQTVKHYSAVTVILAITVLNHNISSIAGTLRPVINLLTSEDFRRVALGFTEWRWQAMHPWKCNDPIRSLPGSSIVKYRVSIKSFSDYKHLLQENYVEYKIYLPLLELVSKILFHVFIVTFGFWMQHFETGGLGGMVRLPWPPRSPDITLLDFFLCRYVKDKVFSTPVPDITN